MDTTVVLPLIPSVDLAIAPGSTGGLTREQLSYLGCVHIVAKDENIDKLLQFLQRHVSIDAYVDVTAVESIDDIISILDAGARKIFVRAAQSEDLKEYGDRVLPIMIAHEAARFSGNGLTGGFLIDVSVDITTCRSFLSTCKNNKTAPVFLLATAGESLGARLELAHEYSAIPIIQATQLTMELDAEVDQVSVPAFIASTWTSDRTDKLVPTVVTDERGFTLGLVYSSRESLAESLKTGKGRRTLISRTLVV